MRTALAGMLLGIGALAWGAELPPSTAQATAQYEAAVAKAKAEYEAKEKAARQVYVLKLQEAALAEGKRGNLDGAVAIKAKLSELNPARVDILGLWYKSDTGTEFRIMENGQILSPGAIAPQYRAGRWTLDKDSLRLAYGNNETISLRLQGADTLSGDWTLKRKAQ
jgi:hypothetical protein